MYYLKVKIEKYVSCNQPGFVSCIFKDVNGKEWRIIEKIPVLTANDIPKEKLPLEGFYVAGEILSEETDKIYFNISKPWGIETEDGETKFKIFRHQLSEKHSDELKEFL